MAGASGALDVGCGDNSVLVTYRSADREVWGTDFESHPCLQNPEWFLPLESDGKIPFYPGTFDLSVRPGTS
jgi:hypothetical protein